MKRQLTAREWILLALLGILLLAGGYMLLFYMPQASEQERCARETESIQTQTGAARLRLEDKRRMEQELEELFSADVPPLRLAGYDNLQAIMQELDSILARTEDYSLSFSTVDGSQSIVRRSISMTFTAGSYASAKTVLQQLHDCRWRCMLDSISLNLEQRAEGSVMVSGTIVFFEYQAQTASPEDTA